MAKIYIGLCSNVGDTQKNIQKAIELLKHKCSILKISSLYDTAPWGFENQDWFINCEVLIETTLPPHELLIFCKEIEQKMLREHTIPNGPRTIDVDIHFYDDIVIDTINLTIPHPRFSSRLCTLIPIHEMIPQFIHPVLHKTIHKLTIDLKNKVPGWEKEIKKRTTLSFQQ
jgi:2-amino-4-hydroxy-6-hydroxymethyldihydropteridine diphosphokinase